MRSGELAGLAGVSTDTLRHYERLGILSTPLRTSGGYRDYPAGARDRVLLIRRALQVGFSLAQLATILKVRDSGGFPCREARDMAASKLAEIKRQMKDLAAMRSHLEKILKDWDARLMRSGKGKPARLLESLPDKLPRVELNKQIRERGSKSW